VTPGEVVVDVVDSGGTGVAPQSNGTGRGLIGMRERAALYGGEVQAGPTDDGFRVHARIPHPFTAESSA
jgi:signal transduction histidine kinase